jgi:hypothetical protein
MNPRATPSGDNEFGWDTKRGSGVMGDDDLAKDGGLMIMFDRGSAGDCSSTGEMRHGLSLLVSDVKLFLPAIIFCLFFLFLVSQYFLDSAFKPWLSPPQDGVKCTRLCRSIDFPA